jgi:16S rRNA (guanine1207-N2)-methyltransferase
MDNYFKKETKYRYKGIEFKFDVAYTLFSSFEVDFGTEVFLKFLEPNNPKTILDLGCGYGPIGIILAKLYPDSKVTMIDKDLLAVKYAKHNAEKNGVSNIEVKGNLALEGIEEKFDLIVSNIPAKIGDIGIEKEFLEAPMAHLNPGGEYWFVVVSGLNRLIPKYFRQNNLKLKEIKKRSAHTVYRYVIQSEV